MSNGVIQIYYGNGHGKSMAALGSGISAVGEGRSVIFIQFLKEKQHLEFLQRLEPELKCFRFEKSEQRFDELSEEEKQEEISNLKNGFSYGRKVITTGACDILIMDEILGLLDHGFVSFDEIKEMLEAKPEDMTVIFTGRTMDRRLRGLADEIYRIEPEK